MPSSLRLALFGPPGAGKGTQAQLLQEQLDIPHISSGDLFRFHVQQSTELGRIAAEYMNQGLLIPDTVGVGIVLDKVMALGPETGFILDGFPRTRDQANILDATLAEKSRGLDKALFIRVPEEELVRRLGGRFVCRQCQSPHALNEAEPGASPTCQRCDGELYQREDDRAEAVQARIEVYHRQTAPVLDYYREQGLLAEVSGVGAIEDINRRAMAALEVHAIDKAP